MYQKLYQQVYQTSIPVSVSISILRNVSRNVQRNVQKSMYEERYAIRYAKKHIYEDVGKRIQWVYKKRLNHKRFDDQTVTWISESWWSHTHMKCFITLSLSLEYFLIEFLSTNVPDIIGPFGACFIRLKTCQSLVIRITFN